VHIFLQLHISALKPARSRLCSGVAFINVLQAKHRILAELGALLLSSIQSKIGLQSTLPWMLQILDIRISVCDCLMLFDSCVKFLTNALDVHWTELLFVALGLFYSKVFRSVLIAFRCF